MGKYLSPVEACRKHIDHVKNMRLYHSALIAVCVQFITSRRTNTRTVILNTLRTGLLNCLNARSRGLNFRHRASCI